MKTSPVCVLTGATSGIGRATAQALAAQDIRLVLLARNRSAAEDFAATLPGPSAAVVECDLVSLASVRAAAAQLLQRFPEIDVLLNNAGIMQPQRQLSVDGHELHWQVNHLSPLLLSVLLLPALRAAARSGEPARLINVSSQIHAFGRIHFDDLRLERRFGMYRAYGQSKLAILLATLACAERLDAREIVANALHPGTVATNLEGLPGWLKPFISSPDKGARSSVWLATAPEAAGLSGQYVVDARPRKPARRALDTELRKRLWTLSLEQLQLPGNCLDAPAAS